MSEGFLSALQGCFIELLTPEAEAAVQLDSLVDDLLNWLSGSADRPELSRVEELQEMLVDLPEYPEKNILANTLNCLNTTLGHSLMPQTWQIVSYLRQATDTLRKRCGHLPLAA